MSGRDVQYGRTGFILAEDFKTGVTRDLFTNLAEKTPKYEGNRVK